jgi:DHA1 family tetracycline resistance protein-like MFS transporter
MNLVNPVTQTNQSDSDKSDRQQQDRRRSALIFILLTSFLNLVGVSIIAPVAPFIAEKYGADAFIISLLFAVNSFATLIAVPGLGTLSDHFGRRPILLISLLGSGIGYIIFGIGGALWVLFLSRTIDGLFAGDVGAVLAYIGDIAKEEERTKYFGWVGAASGLGFVIGPIIGGVLVRVSYATPFFAAGAITLVNMVYGYFRLPESLPRENRTEQLETRRLNPLTQLTDLFAFARLRWLLIGTLLYSLPFAMIQANLSVYIQDRLQWDAIGVSSIFFVIGTVGIIMQLVIVPWLQPRLGEGKVAFAGMVTQVVGLLMLAVLDAVGAPLLLYCAVAAFAAGNGMVIPSLASLLSRSVAQNEQGKIQGGSQSLQALARVIGPAWAGLVYEGVSRAAPYWSGSILVGLGAVSVLKALPQLGRVTQSKAQGAS